MKSAVGLATLILLIGCKGSATDTEVAAGAGPGVIEDPGTVAEEATVKPLRRNTVEVYFPSLVDDGLVSEYREIFETATPGDRAKQIVADLISGPTGEEASRAVPPGTFLRQAYVLDDGTAYLDFSEDLAAAIGGGSMRELLTVYAIVDSVVLNVAEITRVAILVEGEPIDSLNGHLDLRRTLAPDHSLILTPVIVEGDTEDTPITHARP